MSTIEDEVDFWPNCAQTLLLNFESTEKWPLTIACDNCAALEEANCLLQHFGRYGAPSQILSDNGSHFVNKVIKEFLQLVDTEHKLTVAYSKEENAMVERKIKQRGQETCSSHTFRQTHKRKLEANPSNCSTHHKLPLLSENRSQPS